MNDSQQRLLSAFVRICITCLFIGLAALMLISRGSTLARSAGLLITASMCFAYLYFFPHDRLSTSSETQANDGGDVFEHLQPDARRALEKKIRTWILREVKRIRRVKDTDEQMRQAERSAEACKSLFPVERGQEEDSEVLISKIKLLNHSFYRLSDAELITLRHLPALYRKDVLSNVKTVNKLNVLEFLFVASAPNLKAGN